MYTSHLILIIILWGISVQQIIPKLGSLKRPFYHADRFWVKNLDRARREWLVCDSWSLRSQQWQHEIWGWNHLEVSLLVYLVVDAGCWLGHLHLALLCGLRFLRAWLSQHLQKWVPWLTRRKLPWLSWIASSAIHHYLKCILLIASELQACPVFTERVRRPHLLKRGGQRIFKHVCEQLQAQFLLMHDSVIRLRLEV